jgi:hypothetical protein
MNGTKLKGTMRSDDVHRGRPELGVRGGRSRDSFLGFRRCSSACCSLFMYGFGLGLVLWEAETGRGGSFLVDLGLPSSAPSAPDPSNGGEPEVS